MSKKEMIIPLYKLEDYKDLIIVSEKEYKQLKEVIEEVREYINTNIKEEYENIEVDEHFGSLLQILDKAKGSE